jgi:glutaredoxin
MDVLDNIVFDFEKPNATDFTIYSKSGCPNCVKIKKLLGEKKLNFTIVDCDEYIIEDKQGFLLFINDLAEKDVKLFPMVFHNSKFIGSYNETTDFINKIWFSFEENGNF